MSNLLAYLEEHTAWELTHKQGWPRSVKWFGRQLNMAEEGLRKVGLRIERTRTGQERTVIIRKVGGWDGDPPYLDDNSPAQPDGCLEFGEVTLEDLW